MRLPSFLKTGNRVFVDGVERFDVTVTIIDGEAVVTQNNGGATPQSGGGPGEEQPPPKK